MRPIDADKIVYSWQIDADGQEHDGVTLQSIIAKMPTIMPEPRKGKWILHEEIKGFPDWICSECGGSGRGDYHYCPWCMAAME